MRTIGLLCPGSRTKETNNPENGDHQKSKIIPVK
jgi:hypothetical protein